MLHRVAARVSVRWGLIAAALGVAAALALAPAGHQRAVSTARLHVKLKAGWSLAGAQHVFTHLPAGTRDGRERWIIATADQLRAFGDEIEESFVEPETEVLSEPVATEDGDSCPITTPAYDDRQGYVGPAPAGIDAPAAWRDGVRGQGVQFADVEGGWNAQHEDLPGARIEHVGGKSMTEPSWRAHGTAVLGEVVGVDNGKGVVGLAPDIERVFTSSIDGQSIADAIDAAAERLGAGDVLLIELQSRGPRGTYIPVEYANDVYAAIAAATARGVVVVEAAGNGYEDLDNPAYRRRFDREVRDSGAIMVGAGAPPRPGFNDRERLDFSNYGGRVDVQGWGRMVATLDYGDLQACDDSSRDRHYTNVFAGTSSASPIVAGAAVLVESAVKRDGLPPLAPRVLRGLLRDTGTPQTGNLDQQIGPRPDLARALRSNRTALRRR